MLKYPFNKILDISNNGGRVWLLMMGHYTPDAIVDIPNAISSAAHRYGVHMQKGYTATMLYLGPDKIPMTWAAMLPTGNIMKVLNVANGCNSEHLTPPAAFYINIMEKLQFAMQNGMKPDVAARHYWQRACVEAPGMPEIVRFFRCYAEFFEDVQTLHAMLKEQQMIPKGIKKKYKPFDINQVSPYREYEEYGLNPHDFD